MRDDADEGKGAEVSECKKDFADGVVVPVVKPICGLPVKPGEKWAVICDCNFMDILSDVRFRIEDTKEVVSRLKIWSGCDLVVGVAIPDWGSNCELVVEKLFSEGMEMGGDKSTARKCSRVAFEIVEDDV